MDTLDEMKKRYYTLYFRLNREEKARHSSSAG
jgi:hypothetical protein